MWVILAVVGIAGAVGYFALRKPKVVEEARIPPPIIPPTVSEVAKAIAPKMPALSFGDSFVHNETGQIIKILKVPSVVDGEYAIEWPSGATGYIHEAQLKSWFTRI